ncbi:hypothetical protein EBS43_08695 [bacterium]|nr:hypothetical protein [bacterium]
MIEWQTLAAGRPGFRVWKVLENERVVQKSQVFKGCCESIVLSSNGVELSIYQGNKTETICVEVFT